MPKRSYNRKAKTYDPARVHAFVDELFSEDLHAKRVQSLSDSTVGVLHAAALGIHAIGRGLAAAKGLADKHAVKQVDRCIGNEKVDVEPLMVRWTRRSVEGQSELFINLDWTEFDADDHSMLVLSLQTDHGRALPLMWKTVVKSKLKDRRNEHEDDLLLLLRTAIDSHVRVVIVADRGFGDQKLFASLTELLGFDFIIRIRSNVFVTSETGETRAASDWVGNHGRMRVLRNALVTADKHPIGMYIAVQDKGMDDIWCLAVGSSDRRGQDVKKRYGKRFTCEETFRDVKDLRYGLGMKWNRVTQPERRDRMMLIATLAIALLTLLGAAGEDAQLDRLLKSNTSKKRTLSLFRQGLRWYQLIPNMPEERFEILMAAFEQRIRTDALFNSLLGGG